MILFPFLPTQPCISNCKVISRAPMFSNTNSVTGVFLIVRLSSHVTQSSTWAFRWVIIQIQSFAEGEIQEKWWITRRYWTRYLSCKDMSFLNRSCNSDFQARFCKSFNYLKNKSNLQVFFWGLLHWNLLAACTSSINHLFSSGFVIVSGAFSECLCSDSEWLKALGFYMYLST